MGAERENWRKALRAELGALEEHSLLHRVFYKVPTPGAQLAKQSGATVVPARIVLSLKPIVHSRTDLREKRA
eukprot:3090598-Amphidinium_carterae.2